jgi:hypothetical protein
MLTATTLNCGFKGADELCFELNQMNRLLPPGAQVVLGKAMLVFEAVLRCAWDDPWRRGEAVQLPGEPAPVPKYNLGPRNIRYRIGLLNARALDKRVEDFFGFKELARDFAGGEGVAGAVGVDFFYGFGDFAPGTERSGWMEEIPF